MAANVRKLRICGHASTGLNDSYRQPPPTAPRFGRLGVAPFRLGGDGRIIHAGRVVCGAQETGAGAVFWNRRYEPAVIARDPQLPKALRDEGFTAESFNAALLHEPWTIENKSGKPTVFENAWISDFTGAGKKNGEDFCHQLSYLLAG